MKVTDVLFADGRHFLAEDAMSGDGREPEVFASDGPRGGAHGNDARRNTEGASLGDPTEVALMEAAESIGLEKAVLEGGAGQGRRDTVRLRQEDDDHGAPRQRPVRGLREGSR